MNKIYRIIPVVGYIIDFLLKDSMIKNPYFKLYHILTGVISTLILTILFY